LLESDVLNELTVDVRCLEGVVVRRAGVK